MIARLHQSDELKVVSKALQTLHQHLLKFQADQIGFTGTPLELFDHVTKDDAFVWLKPLRDAIVSLDDRRSQNEPVSEVETKAFGVQIRKLFEAKSGTFRENLNSAFQSHPDTIVAMAQARKSLDALN